ncbi:FecR family protein [Echinicola rosea]|uniref:Anti-sigma factor n=1 Tax=Echinicola rosea TaxID=1807691 RepID=A0ABQ1UTG4_9BACT|nr:FecR domain-containing protein [Echinicola rosea]GGF24666.1 anti-sigma factor [Echinicola rosea]
MKRKEQQLFENYLKGRLSENRKKLVEEFYEMESRRTTGWDTLRMGNKEDVKRRIKPRPVSGNSRRRIPIVNIAASLLLALAVSFIVFVSLPKNPPVEMVEKTTAYGQTSTIHLEDGSTIWLNAGSTVSYPKHFPSGSRQVNLVGEAFFEIRPDVSRPFVVSTPTMTTTVLGTSFNITAYHRDPTTITVSTGKVLVQRLPAAPLSPSKREMILYPNEQVVLKGYDSPMSRASVNAERYSSWRTGEYFLDQMTMGTLAGTLERRFGVRFIFHDEQLKDCQLSGRVKKQSLSALMELLATTLAIEYKIDGKKVHLYGRSC